MYAWRTDTGYTQIETPHPGVLHDRFRGLPSRCEVLVQVLASSVNPADQYATTGTMGSDLSGRVVSMGDGCNNSRLSVGASVWGDIGAVTYTLNGNEKTKENGAYAEYAVALDSQLGWKPKNVDFQEAAALPKVSLTSYKALVWYANATNWTRSISGPVVLILGGSGGTGSTGIQLAKALGAAEIITTTSSANFDYCAELGADRLIDYKAVNWWEELKEGSVDIVYDTVGQQGTGDRALKVLRSSEYFGSYVTIAGALPTVSKPGISSNMFINSDTNLDSAALLEELTLLGEKGQLRMPSIQQKYRLDEVAAAFKESSTGTVKGKLVIDIENSTVTGTRVN